MTPTEFEVLKEMVDVLEYPASSWIRKAIAHIDLQAVQIATLKAALVSSRETILRHDTAWSEGKIEVEAKKELAQEMPAIFGGEE